MVVRKPVDVREQLVELIGEVVDAQRLPATAQRDRGELVGARRPTETEVDPIRMQRLEHAKRLGDLKRRMVRQHDPARADADV